jgi:glutathione S-transferase
MITLYGWAISNYYNKVKFTLLEKGIPFNEEMVIPSQDQEMLQRSPLGKIPFIKSEDGYVSESQAIIEYLEDAFPANALYPASPYQRAKCREFIQHLELNVELIARRLYGEAIFGNPTTQEVKDEVKTKVESGLIGLNRMIKLEPYMMGADFTFADVVAWPHLQLIGFATQKIYGADLVIEHIPGIQAYIERVESRPHAQTVSADRGVALAKFFESRS